MHANSHSREKKDEAWRRSGMDVVGDVPWGTHFCQFYETGQDLVDVLVPYFREGLLANEFCMWVTSEPLQADGAKAALRAAVPDLDEYIEKGQIEILDYREWYTRSGSFRADEVLEGWVEKLHAAMEKGFQGLRLTGNTFWLEDSEWKDFTSYEESVNGVIGKYRMLAVCTYCLQKCDAAEVLDVVSNHQFALIKRSGKWEIIESARHRKMEQALRDSEEKLSVLYSSMVEGVALHKVIYDGAGDPQDYVITDVNPSFEKITGLSRNDALGRRASELYGTNEPPYLDIYARVASSGRPESFETNFEPMKKHFSISVFSPSRGKFATVFSDITEHKRLEESLQEKQEELEAQSEELEAQNEELRNNNVELAEASRKLLESEDRLRFVLETCRIGAWDMSIADQTTIRSPEHDRIYGYDVLLPEWTYEMFLDHVLPEDRAQVDATYQNAIKNQTSWSFEFRIRHPDGQVHWIWATGGHRRDQDGVARRAAGIVLDITERKKAEEELRRKQAEVQTLLENTPAGLVLFEGTHPYKVLAHNRYYQELFAEPFHSKGMVGLNVYEYAPAVDAEGIVAVFDEVVRTKQPKSFLDFPYKSNPPKQSWFNWHMSPLILDGKVAALVSMSLDVTDRHLAERALEKSYEELSDANEELAVSNEELRAATEELQGEIKNREQAEKELKTKERDLSRAQAAAHLGSWRWDLVNDVVTWSDELYRIFGVDPKTFVPSSEAARQFIHPNDLDLHARLAEIALTGKPVEPFESRVIRPEGEERTVLSSGFNVEFDESNKPTVLFGTILDVTERKKAEEALRESEEKFRAFAENTDIQIIMSTLPDGEVLYTNPSFEAKYLYSDGELVGGKTPDLYYNLEERKRVLQEFQTRGFLKSFEMKGKRKDGTWFWNSLTSRAIEFGGQKVAITAAADITDRKRAEEALREAKDQLEIRVNERTRELEVANTSLQQEITEREHAEEALKIASAYNRSLIEASLDSLVTIGPDGKITDVNAATEALTGQSRVELIGTDFSNYFTEPEKARNGYQQVFKEGSVFDYALEIRRFDGCITPVLYNASVYRNEAGETVGVFAAARDITERKRAEKELLNAKEMAEAAVEAKAAFLANMSHELRTPMNAVIGFSSLLLDDSLTAEQKEYIEGIRRGGEALLAIINDVLEFSRADQKRLELEHQPFSLNGCIEESLDLVAVQANEKGLDLSRTIRYGTPDTIIGDHGRLRQVLVNLLTNAVKFTDEGNISLSVSSKHIVDGKREILFEVKDTGIGIPKDKMEQLFQPFTQLERTISLKRDGVGLGLSISKRLVELMGGRIWAESIPGRGATFGFTIQAAAADGRESDTGRTLKAEACETLSGRLGEEKPLKILVAEDNPSNQRVLVEMLKKMGYMPDAVADGKEVLQALEIRPYDVILMDVRMPEMDGITATRLIRKLQPEKGPRIIAVTAYALDDDHEICMEAGMDDYIAKPVKKDDLAEHLRNIPLTK